MKEMQKQREKGQEEGEEEGRKEGGKEGEEEEVEEEERSRNHNCDDDNVVCLLSHLKSNTRTHLILPSARSPSFPCPFINRVTNSLVFFSVLTFISLMQISRCFSPLEICQCQKVSERLGVKSAFPQGSVLIITAPQSNKHTQREYREKKRGERGGRGSGAYINKLRFV